MIPVVLLLLLLAGSTAAAQVPSASERSLAIPRVSTPPTLEDYLDGTPRPDEVAITTFVQREPGDGVPASQPTEANLSGLRPFLADGAEADASLTLKPTERLRIDGRYLFTRLRARDDLAAVRPGTPIVSNHIWRSRAAYQFTRSLSLRAIVDYSAVLPDRELIDLDRDKRLTSDILLTYQLDPWTAAYVGYTDGYGNLEIDPLFRARVRRTDSVFHSTGRQLFVKMSYLLRF